MEHTTKSGEAKIVKHCTYPLTGLACVDRIYTDLAVIEVTRAGLEVLEMAEGLAFEELQRVTGAPLALRAGARHG
jgi:3-oxoadipate CoA-transferase, beta subunit